MYLVRSHEMTRDQESSENNRSRKEQKTSREVSSYDLLNQGLSSARGGTSKQAPTAEDVILDAPSDTAAGGTEVVVSAESEHQAS